jgi:hypothetical protein
MIRRSCEQCGVEIQLTAYRASRGQGRFCSRACKEVPEPLELRFARFVDRLGPIPPHRPELGPCHLWTGHRQKSGRGQIWVDGTNTLAARVAFFLTHNRWPKPCCLHHCDNPTCVRPDHLFEGTKADNATDCKAKGRTRKGVRATCVRLDDEAVRRIRERRQAGWTFAELAWSFRVSIASVYRVVARRTWSHVA